MGFNLFVFFYLSMICLSVFEHFIPCLQSTECSITIATDIANDGWRNKNKLTDFAIVV